MKKLLLASTVLAGVAMMAAPASAAMKLDLGGYFSGYGVWADNDETASMHEFDLRRVSELYVSGESTLDNGLTVGFHTEQNLGAATMTDEVYAYFSGGWGRANLGSEDGAAYLLQVGAPSADSNIDGMRTYVQALNPSVAVTTLFTTGIPGLRKTGPLAGEALDYDHVSDSVPNTERLTYMTPKFEGFQAGVSFAPTSGQQSGASAIFPLTVDTGVGEYDNIWELGARWDGEYQGFGISVGGGYSHADQMTNGTLAVGAANEDTAPVVDDGLTKWNAGINLAFSGFSLGGSFLREETSNLDTFDAGSNAGVSDTAVSLEVIQDTWTVGAGYDNGPWHAGASWLNQNQTRDGSGTLAADGGAIGAVDATAEKFTVGGGYTFGPGMTFRGAVAWGSMESDAIAVGLNGTEATGVGAAGGSAATSQDFSQVTVGTDIQF